MTLGPSSALAFSTPWLALSSPTHAWRYSPTSDPLVSHGEGADIIIIGVFDACFLFKLMGETVAYFFNLLVAAEQALAQIISIRLHPVLLEIFDFTLYLHFLDDSLDAS